MKVHTGGIAAEDEKAFLVEVEKWQEVLRVTANIAFELDGAPRSRVEIPEDERKSLRVAANNLYAIDELIKIVNALPYPHARAYGLSCLCSVIGASFAIGSHASVSKTQRIYQHKAAQSKAGNASRKQTPKQARIDEMLAQHRRSKPNAKDGAIAQRVIDQWGYVTPPPHIRTVQRRQQELKKK